jgi:hypothetical protein
MRTTFNLQRLRVLQRRRNKEDNTPPLITCRDVLISSRSPFAAAISSGTWTTQWRLVGVAGDNRQPGGAPLWKAVFQSTGFEATRAKCCNGLVGQDAVGAAAISDDLSLGVEFGEARFEVTQRDVHCARQMSQREFVFRPDVENSDRAGARSPPQLVARHGFQAVTIIEIVAHQPLDLGHVPLSDPAQRRQQIENGVVGKPVIDEFTVVPVCHHAGAPHVLEMLRGVRDRQTGSLRQHFDTPLALGKLFQQLEAVRMSQRFRDHSELDEQRVFRTLT